MRVREEAEGKEFGVIVMAEGLAEYLPASYLEGVPRRARPHRARLEAQPGPSVRRRWSRTSTRSRPARRKRLTGLQLGYEARCARPHAFDVMLGSQLGVGAYRALVEKRLDGVMVSVSGQLNLNYVPFDSWSIRRRW